MTRDAAVRPRAPRLIVALAVLVSACALALGSWLVLVQQPASSTPPRGHGRLLTLSGGDLYLAINRQCAWTLTGSQPEA
jgi:hypothetical protein